MTNCKCIGFGICKKDSNAIKHSWSLGMDLFWGDIEKIIPKGQRLKTGKKPMYMTYIEIHSCRDPKKQVETLEPKRNDARDKRLTNDPRKMELQ